MHVGFYSKWFDTVFVPAATARNTTGAPILLIIDGHGSHLSDEVVPEHFYDHWVERPTSPHAAQFTSPSFHLCPTNGVVMTISPPLRWEIHQATRVLQIPDTHPDRPRLQHGPSLSFLTYPTTQAAIAMTRTITS